MITRYRSAPSAPERRIRPLVPLAITSLLGLAGCSGSSGGEGPSALCQEGDWLLSTMDLTPGGACVEIGLDGALVNLFALPTAPSPDGTPVQVFGVSTGAFEIDTSAEAPSLSALISTLDPNPGDDVEVTVDLMGLTGVYYLPGSDVTVTLATGPTPEQFAQVTADCDAFTTFIEFTAYAGRWLETWPAGVAPELCAGEVRLQGVRPGSGSSPATVSQFPIQGLLDLEERGERIMLGGFLDAATNRAFLSDGGSGNVRIELQGVGLGPVVAAGRLGRRGEERRLEGVLQGARGRLQGWSALEGDDGRVETAFLRLCFPEEQDRAARR